MFGKVLEKCFGFCVLKRVFDYVKIEKCFQ
jgi:hypothetical protein